MSPTKQNFPWERALRFCLRQVLGAGTGPFSEIVSVSNGRVYAARDMASLQGRRPADSGAPQSNRRGGLLPFFLWLLLYGSRNYHSIAQTIPKSLKMRRLEMKGDRGLRKSDSVFCTASGFFFFYLEYFFLLPAKFPGRPAGGTLER